MLKINSKIIAGLLVAFVLFVGASSASAAWMATTATKIMKGSPKADVMWLQQTLNATGTTPALVEDGLYGKKTTAAIKAFQASHPTSGVADGIAGKKTIAALNAAGANGTPNLGCSAGQMYNPNTGLPCVNNNNTNNQSGPITAMLSMDNPASGTIVAGQATADLMHVTFTGNGTVSSVTLTRGGVSDQNTLTNVYLYDGVQRLTDGYSFNTNGTITMNNLNLAVNGSRTVSVKADVYSSTSSYDIYVTLSSFSAGTSVNTVAIKGNDMYIAGSGSLATASVSAQTLFQLLQ
jgi:peptidoglycan hydrolase-like protein with peptidoglycan-binding domain